ncbi:MAG: FAD-linked sulfhydryl oxidase [Sulfobacillus sp.]
MDPKIWGACMWKSLFSVALTYPLCPGIEDQMRYGQFFESLKDVLPCANCRRNYRMHCRELPYRYFLSGRRDLLLWLTRMHNAVNREQGKPERTIEFYLDRYFANGRRVRKTPETRDSRLPIGTHAALSCERDPPSGHESRFSNGSLVLIAVLVLAGVVSVAIS